MTLLAIWALFLGAARAGAPPGSEAVAGFEGSAKSGYGFASFTSPSFESQATLVARLTTSYLYYAYPGALSEMRVQSPGIGVAAGVRWRPARASLTAVVGYEARYIVELDPEENLRAHADHGVSLAADVYLQATPRVALAASGYYGFAQDYLWCRALAKHRLFPWEGSSVATLWLGLDGTVRGNDTVRGLDAGVLIEGTLPAHHLSIGLHLGLGREVQAGADDGLVPSLGISVYKSF
ncbi:hypothetical protein LBMAG42_34000 [Deltaproteobacteria bacterium]|nr:hypothetical protein LBMAG42_34000 [Deltaproteobacteria bacterium]